MKVSVVVKDVARPKLTLAFDGRIELKVPPSMDQSEVSVLEAMASELATKTGIPAVTIRGRFRKLGGTWKFGIDG